MSFHPPTNQHLGLTPPFPNVHLGIVPSFTNLHLGITFNYTLPSTFYKSAQSPKVPSSPNFTSKPSIVAEPGLILIGCCNKCNDGYAADGYSKSTGVELAASEFSGNGSGLVAAANTLISTFLLVFVAEWGDKSFFSTIALAAASSPVRVIAGALAGHGVATLVLKES